MFKKQETYPQDVKNDDYEKDSVEESSKQQINTIPTSKEKVNTILKGSKLIGDINVPYDLELSGEAEGNITSDKNSNITIKGICKGNIKTKEGNVSIDGEVGNGDIFAGGDVKITGKFKGEKIEAKGKIYVNGEFNGKLEGNEIEIGSSAQGKGELLYKEYISISRGAKVEVQISHTEEKLKEVKKSADMKVVNLNLPTKDMSEVIENKKG